MHANQISNWLDSFPRENRSLLQNELETLQLMAAKPCWHLAYLAHEVTPFY